jgi:hypothetical protein
MNYLLVENRQTILLGPIVWKPRFIQSELDELEVSYIVPPVEQGYIKINDNLEIIPIVEAPDPGHDPLYEELAGPYYTYTDNTATMTYNKIDRKLDDVKGNYKQLAAAARYSRETSGTSAIVGDNTIALATDVASRANYLNLLNTVGEGTINYKTNGVFVALNATGLQALVDAVNVHVQDAFNWEKGILDQIDAATSIEELKAINLG